MKAGNDLPALAVKRPLLVAVMNVLIVIAGLAAILGVEVRELPDVDRPVVSVNATFPGAAPETVDAEVTSIVEGAVARVSGVRDIRAASEENSMRLRAEFEPGTNLDSAAADVREAVSQIVRDLPERVEQLVVRKSDEDAEPIVQLAVTSEVLTQYDLTTIVQNDIVPELVSIDGVAAVDPFGARERQLRVVVDPLRLTRFGLTVADVAAALAQAPFDEPVGSFRSGEQELIVRAEASATTPALVEDVIVAGDTRIGDVAEAFFAPADATNFVRLDGRPMVGLGVIRQAQSNTIEISRAVNARVARLNERFDDLEITVTADDAVFIGESVSEVITTLLLTIAIVVATIWCFFGTWRATLAPSSTIPIALIGAVAGIWLFGFSINLLTLLALVLATGLIVDDAIVVLENVQRLQARGVPAPAAAVLGTRQVFFAVVSTTAVLVAVFLPIAFLPSTTGRMFREFGLTLALAVVVSSFVALTIVPAMAARLRLHGGATAPGGSEAPVSGGHALPPAPAARDRDGAGSVQNGTGGSTLRRLLAGLGEGINSVYGALLGAVLAHPLLTTAAALAALAGALWLATSLEREIVPAEDRGRIYILASGPDGAGLEYSERQAHEVEDRLAPFVASGEITSLFTVVGRYDPNRTLVTAPLAPWSERSRSQSQIVADVRRVLADIPGSQVRVFGRSSLNFGGGAGAGLEVALTGPTYPEIFAAARELVLAIEARARFLDKPEISYQPTQPQLSIRIDRQRAADLGVPLEALAATLRVMVGGDEVVDLNVDDRAVPIFLVSRQNAIADPADLRNLYVRADGGSLIPLSTLTQIVEEGVAAELDRTAQRRAIEIDSEVVPGATLAEATAEIQSLADEVLPQGIELVLEGDASALNEAIRDAMLTFAFALVIVFLVLVAQFESITSPLVILLTVPFGIASAILALAFSGVSLNIYSQIGLIMLIGLMAKNGILLVEFADQLRAAGRSAGDAVFEAARRRLRPISMTLISTVLGAVPLVLAEGAGAEARSAIGWVVFGGLGLSALFTLFLNPVIYLLLSPLARPRSAGEQRLEEALEGVDASVL
jgi:multidrug efflux pump subunit AcrB